MTAKSAAEPKGPSFMDKLLNAVERVGNKVPHPVLMFFYLMIGVIILSAILSLFNVSVTEQIAVPVPVEVTPNFYEDVSEYTLSGVGSGDTEFVIQEQTTAENGEIVVALVEGQEATLKTFRRRGSTIALEAANPAYETRVFPDHLVKVQGRLVGLIRSY